MKKYCKGPQEWLGQSAYSKKLYIEALQKIQNLTNCIIKKNCYKDILLEAHNNFNSYENELLQLATRHDDLENQVDVMVMRRALHDLAHAQCCTATSISASIVIKQPR